MYLNDDLPQLINERRSKFRIISKLAKSQKIPVSNQNSQITVNNVTYSHRNIDCLPNGLRLEDAKIVKVKGGLAFHSEHAWLSNFFPCSLDIQGLSFHSSEQAYQYTRAIRLNDSHLAKLILRSKDAKEAKLLSHSNKTTTPEWDNDRFDVMRHLIMEKFTQNFDLGGKLVSTCQQTLIEATIDGFWGAKASITSKSIKDGTWMGANFLGKSLMEVRDELRRDVNYANFLNAPLQVTLDYTPPTQPLPEGSPSSESSQEGTSRIHRHAHKKKPRIYSPKSSLPPVRRIGDLFSLPEVSTGLPDTSSGGADFV